VLLNYRAPTRRRSRGYEPLMAHRPKPQPGAISSSCAARSAGIAIHEDRVDRGGGRDSSEPSEAAQSRGRRDDPLAQSVGPCASPATPAPPRQRVGRTRARRLVYVRFTIHLSYKCHPVNGAYFTKSHAAFRPYHTDFPHVSRPSLEPRARHVFCRTLTATITRSCCSGSALAHTATFPPASPVRKSSGSRGNRARFPRTRQQRPGFPPPWGAVFFGHSQPSPRTRVEDFTTQESKFLQLGRSISVRFTKTTAVHSTTSLACALLKSTDARPRA
jgi:hypothetical protein